MRRQIFVTCKGYLALLSLVLGFVLGVVHSAAADSPDKSPSAAGAGAQQRPLERYRIQPGDMLMVSVWKEQDMLSEVLVRPDGGLSFPLAGEIDAAGRTVEEIRQTIDERLQKYIPNAVVTVAVKLIGGNRVYVIGKVNRPGEFSFSRPLDVMQALSLAGGTTSFAALNDIRILRRENGKQRSIEFRYADVESGRRLEQNILLQSGDTVVVP